MVEYSQAIPARYFIAERDLATARAEELPVFRVNSAILWEMVSGLELLYSKECVVVKVAVDG